MAPILDRSGVQTVRENWRAEGLTTGFTCGAFDLLHAGHADYLQRARGECDRLIVAVNSDDSVRTYKNPLRPIVAERHRMKLIAALSSVDAVTLMQETRPSDLIRLLRPEVYIKGGDYHANQLKSASLVESYGGRIALIPVEHELSSTAIIQRIQELAIYAQPETTCSKPNAPIVFLDRDGTIIENVHFLKDPDRVKLLPGVGEGLRQLEEAGFRLVIVTNQQAIGIGYIDYSDFVAVNSAMMRQLSKYNVRISKIYYCPHSFAERCDCRKPGARLIERGLDEFKSPPDRCFLIGDSDSDVRAASRAGATGILLSQSGSAWQYTASTFKHAVEIILNNIKQGSPN